MIASLIYTVAGLVYGGALLTFALLLNFRASIPHVRDQDVVRVYRAFGAGFGISLGLTLYAVIWHYPSVVNPAASFPASYTLPADPLLLARVLLLGFGWVSYTILEVWTLEKCRQLDKNGVVTDPVAYAAVTGRVARHLALNAALFATVVALGVWAPF